MISSGRPAAGGPDAQACICKDSGTGQSVAQHCATRMPARRPQAKCSLCAAISAESPLEIRNERRLGSALLLTSPVTQHEDVIDRGGPRRAGRLGGLSLSAEGHAGWPDACRCRGCPGQAGGRARHADRRAERAAARRRVLSTSRAGRRSARIQFAMTRAFWSPLTGTCVRSGRRTGPAGRPDQPLRSSGQLRRLLRGCQVIALAAQRTRRSRPARLNADVVTGGPLILALDAAEVSSQTRRGSERGWSCRDHDLRPG